MLRKLSLIVLSLLLSLFCLSCATAGFTQTGEKYPAYKGIVKVFDSPPENITYKEIGRVSAQGGSSRQWANLLNDMQKKAAKNGANAIILLKKDTELKKASVDYTPEKGLSGSASTQKSMLAIAIRIIE